MMEKFQGYDHIFLSQTRSDGQIIDVLSRFFSALSERIVISRNLAWLDLPHKPDIVCEITEIGGSFPMCLNLILFDRNLSLPNRLAQVAKFSEMFECDVLVDDVTTLSPFIWIVVHGSKHYHRVAVDHERLNEGEFVIKSPINDDKPFDPPQQTL
jgi:hypothetical protein